MNLVNGGLAKHVCAEIWGGEKTPIDGWTYHACNSCGKRWRVKTVVEQLGSLNEQEGTHEKQD